ncbi:MAG: phosphoribosylformylglycinamidine synthase subunit PurL [Bacteroidetes bacterium]|nr:phosphoribosylformylglycinamidine synthase subunit PurL [Bacteroidota bacterium]
MEVTVSTAEQLRLTAKEFDLICKKLGRTPNFNELCAFSGMWSEHCSYKNSIKWLKTLPREGGRMLVKAGEENAGLMDIGDGLGVVFKIESHNHPSAIEPFQGAATGVGGIHRDIFTMGARPIAALNSLRFGLLEDEKTQHLLAGVVHGIGHYGNCFGVPTVGGEIYFDRCYHTNPLVNAMSVGIVKVGQTVSATAKGAGNPVLFVGSATGKDGIGGASFASADLNAESTKELPAVQVGDPFQEKKLLEACLEVIQTGSVVGMQDMGAAGIICSTAEMSAKGGVGMRIDLDKVPTRQPNMKTWELLLSESQERMLLVAQKGKEELVKKVFEKWDLPCAVIGEVTDDGLLNFYMKGQLDASIPAQELVLGGGAPQYDRVFTVPAYLQKIERFEMSTVPLPIDLKKTAKQLIKNPTIASKKWIYRQYDSMVGTNNTNTNAPSDAAVVLVKGTKKGIAITTDCNSRYVMADPKKGAMIAVSEAARNIICAGGEPLGVTNCLNFANPYDPEVYFQFKEVILGMGEACRFFNTPVTGGNVSFYNQNPDGPVNPTPTIGMVGLLEDVEKKMSLDFKNGGDEIYLLGSLQNDLGSSVYLHEIAGHLLSPAPYFSVEEELALHQLVKSLIQAGVVESVHDCSEGGLLVALMEKSFNRLLGFSVRGPKRTSDGKPLRIDACWFGESQSRVVVSVSLKQRTAFLQLTANSGTPVTLLGKTTQGEVELEGQSWGNVLEWKNNYDSAIEEVLNKG